MTASDRTKRLLAAGLKELSVTTPLRKVRVGELCERCGVDRRTFYYHFRDIYDLAAWIFDQTVDDCIPFMKGNFGERGVEVALNRIRADEVFYCRALAEDSQNALGRHFLSHMVDLYKAALRQVRGKEELTEEETFAIGFQSFASLGMVRRWLFYEKDRSPAELAALFLKTMPPLLLCLYSDENEEKKGE